jgi:SNF2 family DNA or RNA helicase
MNLWQHQQKAVELAREKPHLALLLPMGTGKTRTMIEILREDFWRSARVRKTLIFAPLSVCAQWKTEFAKFSKIPQDKIHVLTMDGKTRAKKLAAIREMGAGGIVVTNYEAVIIKAFYEEMLAWAPEIMVLDECQRLKNAGSVRSKRIYPLCMTASRRFILTGTLFTNCMLDIYGPYKALDASIFGPSFFAFRKNYFYDKNAGMPSHAHFPNWQPQSNAKSSLTSIIAQTSVQAKREDCLTLPPLVKVNIPLEMSPTQRQVYASMEKEFVAELKGSVVISEFAMTVQLRLRQILAGFVSGGADQKPVFFDENPRLEALSDLIEGMGGQQCLVWCNFVPIYQKITERLDKLGVKHAVLTGQQTAAQKQAALDAFKAGEAQVLLSNPAAGGVGLNLAEAPYSIYYDKSYNLEHYLQSSARNYRAGSERHTSVTQYSLSARGTVDEVIEDALGRKDDLGKTLMEWARKKALDPSKSNDMVEEKEEEEGRCLPSMR